MACCFVYHGQADQHFAERMAWLLRRIWEGKGICACAILFLTARRMILSSVYTLVLFARGQPAFGVRKSKQTAGCCQACSSAVTSCYCCLQNDDKEDRASTRIPPLPPPRFEALEMEGASKGSQDPVKHLNTNCSSTYNQDCNHNISLQLHICIY